MSLRSELPSGTVTFVFTDVEGSTRLLHELGAEGYAAALAEHRQIVRATAARHGGVEVDTQGDAFFIAFPTAPGALAAVAEAMASLERTRIRIRVGVHTGTPVVTEEGYVGDDVHRAARIAGCGHGGQILVSAATAALAGTSAELHDLGEHRLKDLSAPERIHQVGSRGFPPLRTLAQTNLPVPATPFLGRAGEVDEVRELLEDSAVRLLTLTGPGGTGKTRLALQAAAAAADSFPNGVWWAPLAPIADARLVVGAAAAALGATAELADYIGSKRLLLLLDNFEHVIEAAAEVGLLLDRCAQLTVLVTSREPLRLDGEHEYAVDPLREQDAVALFAARARAARRDFEPNGEVGAICARLDHLPLAIELAAARVKVLPPAALLDRLDRALPVLTGGARNAPERQQTLRATVEWSHELLDAEEQELFRRLGVFAGGATLEACEAVCGATLDCLSSLVDKSLVRQAEGRFWMLRTIREFAIERLEAAGEAEAVRARHADYFAALAEDAADAWEEEYMRVPGARLAEAERELPNLRLALDHLVDVRDRRALQLVASLPAVWISGARVAEGLRRTADALAVDDAPTHERARALHAAAELSGPAGELGLARRFADEAVVLGRALGDPLVLAEALWASGYVACEEGRWEAALEQLDECVRLFEECGALDKLLWARRTLAWALLSTGDEERGWALHEENLAAARAAGSGRIAATLLGILASKRVSDGRLDEALPMLREAMLLFRGFGSAASTAAHLVRVAAALGRVGEAETALRVLAASDAWREELGYRIPWVDREAARIRDELRATLDPDAFAAAAAAGVELSPDDAVGLALAGLGGASEPV